MLTDKQLSAIRARCESAEPGPWTVSDDYDEYGKVLFGTKRVTDICWCGFAEEDAEFIAHAREDVPELLAEIERLRVENAGLLERWLETAKELADMLPRLESMRLLQSVGRPS